MYESICLVYGILFSQNAYEIEEVKKENLDFKAVLRFWLIHGEMLIKELRDRTNHNMKRAQG